MTCLFTSFTFEDHPGSFIQGEIKLVTANFFYPSPWIITFDRSNNLIELITLSDSSEVVIQTEQRKPAFNSLTEMSYIIPCL